MPKISIKEENQSMVGKGYIPPRSLSLVLTTGCNLRCTYCYEKHDCRNDKVMDLKVAQEAITRELNSKNETWRINIELFGGEPFIAFPLMKEIVKWTIEQNWPKEFHFMIGTNGTIFNDEIKEWLLENKRYISLGVSIDGTKKAHDMTRDNSYDLVRRNLPFFMEHWPHQPAKMTISTDTIPYVADGIIELEELGLYFTANIGFEDMWGAEDQRQQLLMEYEKQLDRLVDYYAKRPELFPVMPLMDAVPDYLGYDDSGAAQKEVRKVKRFCGAGHEMSVVDVDGSVYPCHRFLPWVTGRAAPKNNANCQMAWKPEKCAECKLILSCPTCAGYNWEVYGDTGIRSSFHCESFKLEVLASSKLEAIRLGQKLKKLNTLSPVEKRQTKQRLEAVMNLIELGV